MWRWESQLAEFHGEVESNDIGADVGWMALAHERSAWRNIEANLAEQHVV